MSDDELKAELLRRAEAGLPRPDDESDDEHERELAEALRRFTTPIGEKMLRALGEADGEELPSP